MAVKASALNDSRRYDNPMTGLKEQTWYQDISGTAVYEFQKIAGESYVFEKRDITSLQKTKRVRIKLSDLSLLIPVEVHVTNLGRRKATINRGTYARTP